MNGLLRSRKFWLACAGVLQAVVLNSLDVPAEVWGSIMALIAVLINSIAMEDAAEKRNELRESGGEG